MPLESRHLHWSVATTVSLDHFSSCPSRVGNSGLTSCKRTVTKLKIEPCPLLDRGLRQSPVKPGGVYTARLSWTPGICFPHQARPAFLDPEAPRALSLLPPPPPGQRLLTQTSWGRARGWALGRQGSGGGRHGGLSGPLRVGLAGSGLGVCVVVGGWGAPGRHF